MSKGKDKDKKEQVVVKKPKGKSDKVNTGVRAHTIGDGSEIVWGVG